LIEEQKGLGHDLRIFRLIDRIGEKMGEFYEVSCRSFEVGKQFSRAMYYRAVALRRTSREYKQI
jgi:hypothetical protein